MFLKLGKYFLKLDVVLVFFLNELIFCILRIIMYIDVWNFIKINIRRWIIE